MAWQVTRVARTDAGLVHAACLTPSMRDCAHNDRLRLEPLAEARQVVDLVTIMRQMQFAAHADF